MSKNADQVAEQAATLCFTSADAAATHCFENEVGLRLRPAVAYCGNGTFATCSSKTAKRKGWTFTGRLYTRSKQA